MPKETVSLPCSDPRFPVLHGIVDPGVNGSTLPDGFTLAEDGNVRVPQRWLVEDEWGGAAHFEHEPTDAEAFDYIDQDELDSTEFHTCTIGDLWTGRERDAEWMAEPPEPECAYTAEHKWEAPWELVRGIKDNPGVRQSSESGAGVETCTVCRWCGTERVIDTGTVDPDNDSLYTSTSYYKAKHQEWAEANWAQVETAEAATSEIGPSFVL